MLSSLAFPFRRKLGLEKLLNMSATEAERVLVGAAQVRSAARLPPDLKARDVVAQGRIVLGVSDGGASHAFRSAGMPCWQSSLATVETDQSELLWSVWWRAIRGC